MNYILYTLEHPSICYYCLIFTGFVIAAVIDKEAGCTLKTSQSKGNTETHKTVEHKESKTVRPNNPTYMFFYTIERRL